MENPYVFEEKHFTGRVKTEHGRIGVLEKFTKRSEFLRGIENFRIAVMELGPLSFSVPTHHDADIALFTATGKGTITLVREEKRESFNIECGDLFIVPAGTPVYLINRDENENLCVVSLVRPVNLPGIFESFHGAGGEDPESFYKAFSARILEAAFKTDREKLERIFKQRRGAIIKASREQIKALSQHEEGGTVWPFEGSKSIGPFNLLHKKPSHSNKYGKLYEARPEECEHLKCLDLMISFADLTKGSMAGPYYNTRSTKISVVLDGEGYLEMACPHVSAAREERTRGEKTTYERISANIKRGTVFVVPAGHPATVVASKSSNNLKVLCFEVNAMGNMKRMLAGKRNVVSLLPKEAKELSFGVRAEEVDQVFNSQSEEFFYPGPQGQSKEESMM